jgi:N-acetyl sugar amidotransferase
MRTGRICTYCVMDDSSPFIEFDERGECDCCRDARARMPFEWHPHEAHRLDAWIDRIKIESRGGQYDAMVGLSGGVDSSYLAHLLRTRYGLRLLAVHVDGGWNTEAAVRNIEVMVRALSIDLYTYVVDWQEMRDIQLAFLRSSVLNQDIPQDHAFFTTLYRTASKFGIRYFLNGVNFSGECAIPRHWGYPAADGFHLRAIHKLFGTQPIKTFPVMSLAEYAWHTRLARSLRILRPLDFVPYNNKLAKQQLVDAYGWKDYGDKHSESRFTQFYQEVYLPSRYGFDKRRLHLSSLIIAGELSREEALRELNTSVCEPAEARHQLRFVAKKLGITVGELQALIDQAPVDHEQYPNRRRLIRMGISARALWRRHIGRGTRAPEVAGASSGSGGVTSVPSR